MPIETSESPQRNSGERPISNIEGELVALGPLHRDLLEPYTRWISDGRRPSPSAPTGGLLFWEKELDAAEKR